MTTFGSPERASRRLSVLLILLVGKLFSYIVASTAGTSGGIFAPVLFFAE
jgi:H+/Cl- antiporter ClcA